MERLIPKLYAKVALSIFENFVELAIHYRVSIGTREIITMTPKKNHPHKSHHLV